MRVSTPKRNLDQFSRLAGLAFVSNKQANMLRRDAYKYPASAALQDPSTACSAKYKQNESSATHVKQCRKTRFVTK